MAQLKSVKALDVLPYHNMALHKYSELGMPYPLEGVPPMDASAAQAARAVILQAYLEAKKA